MASAAEEYAYHEGFVDGQLDVIETIAEIFDSNDDNNIIVEEIQRHITQLKKDIDSL